MRVVQFLGLPALDEGEAGGIFNALVQRVEDAPLFGLGRDDEGGERAIVASSMPGRAFNNPMAMISGI